MSVTQEIILQQRGITCRYRVINFKTNRQSLDRHLDEFRKEYGVIDPKVVNLDVLVCSHPGKGDGTHCLHTLKKKYKGIPILLQTGFLSFDDVDAALNDKEYFNQFFSRLNRFYEKNGFVNVNDRLGHYRYGCCMYCENGSGVVVE